MGGLTILFREFSCRALGPLSCPADAHPAGGGGGDATGEASPQAMSRRHCRMLPQGNATFAGFVVARQRSHRVTRCTLRRVVDDVLDTATEDAGEGNGIVDVGFSDVLLALLVLL